MNAREIYFIRIGHDMREPDHNSLDIISVEPTKSGWFKKVILILFGIVLSFIILEVGLRCLGFAAYEMKETDAGTGLRVFKASSSIPYRSICFSNTIKTNSLGFHSREYSREKPPNVRRIIVVGDSFVESAQVSLEKSFFLYSSIV